ncbi:MAG: hypothetical protein AAGF11_49520 [Myxococcota bacterium]
MLFLLRLHRHIDETGARLVRSGKPPVGRVEAMAGTNGEPQAAQREERNSLTDPQTDGNGVDLRGQLAEETNRLAHRRPR